MLKMAKKSSYDTSTQVGLEAFINLAKSSKLLDLTTPSFRNVDR